MLFMYFYNVAINTTDMTTRLISCAAMTFEVYFIRKHIKIMRKLNIAKNENTTKDKQQLIIKVPKFRCFFNSLNYIYVFDIRLIIVNYKLEKMKKLNNKYIIFLGFVNQI